MTRIYDIPAWLFMVAAAVLSSGLAASGLYIVRTRLIDNDAIDHNDVAGPILATIGTILAVILSFMVAGVWSQYDQAAQTAQVEASAISDLHHLADAYPPAERETLHEQLDRYADTVINVEWPLMRRGEHSDLAQQQAYAIQRNVVTYKAPGERGLVQGRALEAVTIMLDARRNRILDNREGIPAILWATMLLMGVVTVAFSFYFRVRNTLAHFFMTMALACVIGVTFALIAELDYPFRGTIAVSPSAFQDVERMIHERR